MFLGTDVKLYRKCDVSVLISQSHFCVCACLCKQVANLNPKDNTYSLKDFMYRDVQRDWPGYSEDERSQVDRTLARYRHFHSLQKCTLLKGIVHPEFKFHPFV